MQGALHAPFATVIGLEQPIRVGEARIEVKQVARLREDGLTRIVARVGFAPLGAQHLQFLPQ